MRHQCLECSAKFNNVDNLTMHYFIEHLSIIKKNSDSTRQCWCGKTWYTETGFLWHIKRRGGLYAHQAKVLFGVNIGD